MESGLAMTPRAFGRTVKKLHAGYLSKRFEDDPRRPSELRGLQGFRQACQHGIESRLVALGGYACLWEDHVQRQPEARGQPYPRSHHSVPVEDLGQSVVALVRPCPAR